MENAFLEAIRKHRAAGLSPERAGSLAAREHPEAREALVAQTNGRPGPAAAPTPAASPARAELERLAQAKIDSRPRLTMSQAKQQVLAANADLCQRFNAEEIARRERDAAALRARAITGR